MSRRGGRSTRRSLDPIPASIRLAIYRQLRCNDPVMAGQVQHDGTPMKWTGKQTVEEHDRVGSLAHFENVSSLDRCMVDTVVENWIAKCLHSGFTLGEMRCSPHFRG